LNSENSWYLISPGELVGVFSALYNPDSGEEAEEIFLRTINRYV